MKLLKKLPAFAIALLLVVSSFQVQAQGQRGGGPGHRGPSIEQLASDLNLTNAQITQLEALQASMKEDMQAARASGDRDAMKALRGIHKEKMAAILTPDQLAQMKEMRAEHKGNKGQMKPGERGGKKGHVKGGKGHGKGGNMNSPERIDKRVQKMTEQLNLSSSQASQVKSILTNYGSEMEALKNSGEQDKTAFKALKKEQKKAIKAILTAEQLQTLKDLKGQKKGKRNKGKFQE